MEIEMSTRCMLELILEIEEIYRFHRDILGLGEVWWANRGKIAAEGERKWRRERREANEDLFGTKTNNHEHVV